MVIPILSIKNGGSEMSSMTFSPLNFVQEQDVSAVLEYRADNYECSYFTETLKFIEESMKEYNSAKRSLYKSLLEYTSDPEVVTESFSDFFGKIKEIIEKFLKFIKSLFERFITSFERLFKNDKYLIKHKADFDKFESDHEFTFSGYEFTFAPNIPSLQPLYKFDTNFMDMGLTKEEIEGKSQEEVAAIVKEKYTSLIRNLDDFWYDEFRADTIGEDGQRISRSDFSNELFCKYRNGTADASTITANRNFINMSYSDFEKYKSVSDSVKRDKNEIEKSYKSLERDIENIMKRNKDRNADQVSIDLNLPSPIKGYTANNDILEAIDLFVKAKTSQVQEMSSIHALAFSAKLDALTASYKQDKAVLYKALYNIQGKPSK